MKTLATMGCVCLAALAAVRAERIQTRTFEYRATISARNFAEEEEVISNPLEFPQIKYVIPDGSYVEKGAVITEFDREALLLHLENQEHDRAIVEADLQRVLTELRNRDMELHDELEALEDQLAVFKTQLKRLQALPEPDDVTIARGRLRVSKLEHEAAEEDMATARDRYDREMISPGEFDDFEQAHKNAKARLAHREGMLEVASRPAEATLLRKNELAIENTRLAIDNLKEEIERNKDISEIERNGAKARVDSINDRIEDTEEDIANAVIHAPASGYIVYVPMFRRHLGMTGTKMWKDFAFMTMPRSDTVALKGQLSESERRFFKVGDPVTVTTSGRPDKPLEGFIKSISALARDREEKERQRYRPSRGDSGIMVYDVVIEPRTRPDWLRVGLSAECELVASEPVTAPSVPATYIKSHNGSFYLAIDGLYQKVEGVMIDGYLLLSDDSLDEKDVALVGEFPENRLTKEPERLPGYRVSGELTPVDTTGVSVGDIYRFQTISWLIEEDTVVTQGTVLVKIDDAETKEMIETTETQLQQAVKNREKEEEEKKLQEQGNRYALIKASNSWESARLDLEELIDQRETANTLAAEMNKALAAISLEFLDREWTRVKRAKVSAYSPLEKAKLERDRCRAELNLEAANIRLKKLRDGALPEAICRGEQKVMEGENLVVNLRKKLETDRLRKSFDLTRAQQAERRLQDTLDERFLEQRNLTLYAPRDGLVRYGKVRSGGSWMKVEEGSMISDRAVPVQIADVSRMYIRMEIPERFYTQTREGMKVKIKTRDLADVTLEGTVSEIEFLFQRKRNKDTRRSLYSSHESLGETVFFVRVDVEGRAGVILKPGSTADVVFPFEAKAERRNRG